MTEQLAIPVAPAGAWLRVRVSNPTLRALRDRHYSTKYPGGATVGAPGERLAFITGDGRAGWITHRRYARLREGFVCSFFRNEGPELSSALVLAALEATEREWGPPPRWLTLVDVTKVRHKRDPGRCFRRAGFRPAGYTSDRGLLVLELERSR